MVRRDYRDITAGAFLIVVGLFVGVYASTHYNIDTLQRIGPGLFPAALGFLLAVLGVMVLVPALFRSGDFDKPIVRPLVAVIVGVVAFALTIERLGMVPAVVLATVASALADTKLGLIGIVILAAVLSTLAWFIFSVLLAIPLAPFRWSF